MKRKLTGLLAALLSAALLLPSAALAHEAAGSEDEFFETIETREERLSASSADLASNAELFAGYISGHFFAAAGTGGNAPISLEDPAGSRLTGTARRLYDLLKDKVTALAKQGGSAVFTFDAAQLGLKTTWTPQELTDAGFSIPHDKAEVNELFAKILTREGFHLDNAAINAVKNALLADCPFDLYWFDKTAGLLTGMNGGYKYDAGFYIDLQYSFAFSVAEGYRAPESTEKAPVVTSDVARVDEAARNAAAIVAKYQGESDYIKLSGYKSEICELTDYNYEAAEGSVAYGDPWQLIWVFDGDPETTVVCEGYSKAFQFLCDLSDFQAADCYTVSGLMGGGTGGGPNGSPGPHMWNIVRIGGKNYLADVTNSDQGSVGQDGGLFLAGAAVYAESEPAGYVVALKGGQNIYYWYEVDGSMDATWGSELLILSEESYVPDSSPEEPTDPEQNVIETPVWKADGTLSVSVSVNRPAYLLAAAYDRQWRLMDVLSVPLDSAGQHSHSFTLPAGAEYVKTLAAGQTGWAPLCASKLA